MHSPCDKTTSRSALMHFFNYFLGGGIATLIHLGILATLVERWSVDPTLATAIGFCVGTAFNYAWQYYFTFRAKGSHFSTFARYTVVTLVMLGVNLALFHALTTLLGMPYLLAQLFATAVIMLCNFAINRLYTFRQS